MQTIEHDHAAVMGPLEKESAGPLVSTGAVFIEKKRVRNCCMGHRSDGSRASTIGGQGLWSHLEPERA